MDHPHESGMHEHESVDDHHHHDHGDHDYHFAEHDQSPRHTIKLKQAHACGADCPEHGQADAHDGGHEHGEQHPHSIQLKAVEHACRADCPDHGGSDTHDHYYSVEIEHAAHTIEQKVLACNSDCPEHSPGNPHDHAIQGEQHTHRDEQALVPLVETAQSSGGVDRTDATLAVRSMMTDRQIVAAEEHSQPDQVQMDMPKLEQSVTAQEINSEPRHDAVLEAIAQALPEKPVHVIGPATDTEVERVTTIPDQTPESVEAVPFRPSAPDPVEAFEGRISYDVADSSEPVSELDFEPANQPDTEPPVVRRLPLVRTEAAVVPSDDVEYQAVQDMQDAALEIPGINDEMIDDGSGAELPISDSARMESVDTAEITGTESVVETDADPTTLDADAMAGPVSQATAAEVAPNPASEISDEQIAGNYHELINTLDLPVETGHSELIAAISQLEDADPEQSETIPAVRREEYESLLALLKHSGIGHPSQILRQYRLHYGTDSLQGLPDYLRELLSGVAQFEDIGRQFPVTTTSGSDFVLVLGRFVLLVLGRKGMPQTVT
jgi:hypothetical protein